MSGKKTYTLLLNSATTKNIVSSPSIGQYTYYVNWDMMLPKEYKEFDLSFQFRSSTGVADPVNTVLLSVNIGSGTMYNQEGSQTSTIGAIIPKSYVTGTTPQYYYESNNTDDCGCIVNYPNGSYITVSIINLNGTAITNFPTAYMLQLCFTVIE